eukprot:6404179-Alexandrium_andersonii.AAC.1
MDQVLWDSRAAIWDTSPPLPPTSADLLSAYFAHRECPVPSQPRPTWRATLAVVLSAGPSSPGPDGLPYEAYQAGSTYVSALAAQAQYAHSG